MSSLTNCDLYQLVLQFLSPTICRALLMVRSTRPPSSTFTLPDYYSIQLCYKGSKIEMLCKLRQSYLPLYFFSSYGNWSRLRGHPNSFSRTLSMTNYFIFFPIKSMSVTFDPNITCLHVDITIDIIVRKKIAGESLQLKNPTLLASDSRLENRNRLS